MDPDALSTVLKVLALLAVCSLYGALIWAGSAANR